MQSRFHVFNAMTYHPNKKMKNKKNNGETQTIFPKFIFHRVFIYFSKGGQERATCCIIYAKCIF